MRKQQLPRFQKKIDSATIGYLNLLEPKELLSVSINLSNSLRSLSSPIRRSILTLQHTLYASLMVDVHSWLFDPSKGSSNLSLYNLLEQLTDKDTKFNTKYLKSYYIAEPNVVKLNESASRCQSEFVSKRVANFDQDFLECIGNIEELLNSGQATRIKLLRNKLLAHKDGVYDVKANGHEIGDVFYLLGQMKVILLTLNRLFQRVSYPIEESEQQAKSNADFFWKHVARTKI
jgi:hypothetical protein